MTQYIRNIKQKALLIILFLITITQSAFVPADRLYTPLELKASAIFTYGYGKLIPFDNQVFGTSYVGSDSNVYALFMKNDSQDPPIQINTSAATGSWKFTQNCKVGNQMFVLYNLGNQIYGQMMNQDGTKSGSRISVPYINVQWNAYCEELSSNQILISYSENTTGAYIIYTLGSPGSFGTRQVFGDFADMHQAYVTKLKSANTGIAVLVFDRRSGAQGVYIQQIDVATGAKIIGKPNQNVYNGAVSFGLYHIDANDDGGFSILYNNGAVNIVTYKPDFTEQCRQLIVSESSAQFVGGKIVTVDGIAYITYKTSSGTQQYVIAVDTQTCLPIDGPNGQKVHEGTNLRGGYIALSEDKTRMGVLSSINNKAFFSLYKFSAIIPCIPSILHCDKCYSLETSCTECQGTTNPQKLIRKRSDTNLCTCQDGYFHDDSFIDCQECDDKCATCNTSATTCQTCSITDTNLLGAPDCICKSGWVFNSSSTACEQCDTTTCVSSCTGDKFNCDSCKETYLKQGSICVQCTSPCRTCSSSLSHCLSCIPGHYKTGNTCTLCPHPFATCSDENTPLSCVLGTGRLTKEENCACSPGFIEAIGIDNCIPCQNPCKTCQSTISHCLTCVDFHYIDGTTCTQCPHPYITCTSENTPTSCKTGLGRLGKEENCQCGPGYFEKGTSDCGQCQYPCSLCQDSPTNCTDCDNRVCGTCVANTRDTCIVGCHSTCNTCNEDGNCNSCKLGYFINTELKCEKCPKNCKICDQNDKNTCLLCPENQIGRSEDISTNCPCLEGYYEEPTDFICKKCQVNGCQQCNSTGICLKCKNSLLLPPNCIENNKSGIGFVIANPNGEEVVLEQCSYKCQSCENSPDNCLVCNSQPNRNHISPCECIDGYHDNYGKQNQCVSCPQHCSKCENEQKCIECESIQNLQLNQFNGQCECKEGYKFDLQSINCQKCYQYQDECLFSCPSNTVVDETSRFCFNVNYNKLDMIPLIIICCLCTIGFNIILSILVGKQSQNKIKGTKIVEKKKPSNQPEQQNEQIEIK